MSRLRSLSFPRISQFREDDHAMAIQHSLGATSSPQTTFSPSPGHSRDSSAASSISSPVTPTFSSRGHHQRWSGSSSISLATTPDSPINMTKPALHDLVEDPAERDEIVEEPFPYYTEEPMCICDTTFCEHNRSPFLPKHSLQLPTPEWSAGDDYFPDADASSEPSLKRRRSNELPADGLAARLSRRLPSISRRFRDSTPVAVLSPVSNAASIHSAPPSRTSSLKLPPVRTSPATSQTDRTSDVSLNQFSLFESISEPGISQRRTASSPSRAMEISIPSRMADPIDRQEMASTPLLPPMMSTYRNRSTEKLEKVSPLQLPSIADPPSSMFSSTPALPTYATPPPLSSKASAASFHGPVRAAMGCRGDVPHALSEETDPWAMKLGHANFHIEPVPYMPSVCDRHTCKTLLQDWEAARMEYLRQTVRISEHYGPTSRIYKLTEEKWAGIDAQWRVFHERANAEAEANGDALVFQPLADNQQALSQMPSLNDPAQPSKFPRIDEADIVGPMVQYAKVQRPPSKKTAFLRIFTDRAALLGGRSTLPGLRR